MEPNMSQNEAENCRSWKAFSYSDVYEGCFTVEECANIIALHRTNRMVQGKILNAEGHALRDSDIFWISRTAGTDWIFRRLWEAVGNYNLTYNFELADQMGQAQLTRYRPGQHYEWHMDLGSDGPSLRKVTAVVELTSQGSITGGGIEVFYGQPVGNKVDLDAGDVLLFPSFVMHRALPVTSGTRWSLVFWLNGTRPLR
jgi:PKHD-type hydroxylase